MDTQSKRCDGRGFASALAVFATTMSLPAILTPQALAQADTATSEEQWAISPRKVFMMLFLMLGPIKILVPFVNMTRASDATFRRRLAPRAVLFSAAALAVAGQLGNSMLDNFNIAVPVLALTGGLALFLAALQTVLQQSTGPARPKPDEPPPGLPGQPAAERKMKTRRTSARVAFALIAFALSACTSVGPATVPRDRIDYGTAIGDSWKQQTLLNIVKLRYGDMPIFLEIAQVIAGYQVEGTISAGANAANNTAGVVGPFTSGGSILAQGKYTDRPTLIYAPLTGNDFLKRLMTPIPPSSVLFLLQSGYTADFVMTMALDSINGVNNESKRGMKRAGDPQFFRLAQLLRDLQLAGAVQVRIERTKGDSESSLIVFGPSKDPEIAAKSHEIRSILGLKPDLQELKVFYGGYSGKNDEIAMMTRSMLQIMLELAAIVQVPASDVSAGKAAPGSVIEQTSENQGATALQIVSGDKPPGDAYVAVPYKGRWFWIADTDIRSKYAFGFVMLLFSISDTGVRGNAPVVTVPASQ